MGDPVAQLALFNTIFYTVVARVIKFGLGLWLALVLNQRVPFKTLFRSLVLLPWIVPTALSALAFWCLYDAQFSVISWTLIKLRSEEHTSELQSLMRISSTVFDLTEKK